MSEDFQTVPPVFAEIVALDMALATCPYRAYHLREPVLRPLEQIQDQVRACA